jgi:hypothetical protein
MEVTVRFLIAHAEAQQSSAGASSSRRYPMLFRALRDEASTRPGNGVANQQAGLVLK